MASAEDFSRVSSTPATMPDRTQQYEPSSEPGSKNSGLRQFANSATGPATSRPRRPPIDVPATYVPAALAHRDLRGGANVGVAAFVDSVGVDRPAGVVVQPDALAQQDRRDV